MRRRVFVTGVSGLLLLLAGCSVVLGLDPPTYNTGDASAPTEGGPTSDAPDTTPPLPGKLDDAARWSTYAALDGAGYMMGPFDGRFIYFTRASDVDGPEGLTGSRVLRYDTTSERFDDAAAWASIDPELSLGTTGPHAIAVMEGKYLVVGAFADHVFLRFDTTLPPNDFTFASSWERFESTDLGLTVRGYNGAAPVPGGGTIWNNGATLTPALHKGESLDAGWEIAQYDAGSLACPTTYNAACSNKNVYFVPAGSDTVACLSRFDTSKPLGTGFDSFDIASLGDEFTFMAGGISTPQHLYVTQYNTKDASAPIRGHRKPIDGALDAGWESQPTNVKNPLTRGFVGGTFDGRYLYFAPYPAPTTTVIFARYDTSLGFNDTNAWEVAAGAARGIPANRYWGAVFDGQYVYYSTYTPLGNERPAMVRYKAYDTKIAVPPVCRP